MKTFRLAAASNNRNAFGLRGAVLIAQDGEAWAIASNDLNFPQAGKAYGVPQPTPAYWALPAEQRDFADQDALTASRWSGLGWELPRRLPDAPAEAIAQVWPPQGPFLAMNPAMPEEL
jgi:hypothetical protein